MSIWSILIVILILAAFGLLPAWPHSQELGYGPSGGLGLLVVVLIILLVLGKL